MRQHLLFVLRYWLFALGLLFIKGDTFAQSLIEGKVVASLKRIFGDTILVRSSTFRFNTAVNDSLAHHSITKWQTDSINIYVCQAYGKTIGYGFIDNVKGKTQFITYLVAIDTSDAIKDVDVLVYRESYGGEIAYESFRKQFRNKTAQDELKPGKDIKNISGATISVRAIAQGVKKILATFDIIRNKIH